MGVGESTLGSKAWISRVIPTYYGVVRFGQLSYCWGAPYQRDHKVLTAGVPRGPAVMYRRNQQPVLYFRSMPPQVKWRITHQQNAHVMRRCVWSSKLRDALFRTPPPLFFNFLMGYLKNQPTPFKADLQTPQGPYSLISLALARTFTLLKYCQTPLIASSADG